MILDTNVLRSNALPLMPDWRARRRRRQGVSSAHFPPNRLPVLALGGGPRGAPPGGAPIGRPALFGGMPPGLTPPGGIPPGCGPPRGLPIGLGYP